MVCWTSSQLDSFYAPGDGRRSHRNGFGEDSRCLSDGAKRTPAASRIDWSLDRMTPAFIRQRVYRVQGNLSFGVQFKSRFRGSVLHFPRSRDLFSVFRCRRGETSHQGLVALGSLRCSSVEASSTIFCRNRLFSAAHPVRIGRRCVGGIHFSRHPAHGSIGSARWPVDWFVV